MNKKLLACPNCKKEKMAVPSGKYECSDCGCRFSISDKGETVPIEKRPAWVVPYVLFFSVIPLILLFLDRIGIKSDPDLREVVIKIILLVCLGARVMLVFMESLQTGRISISKRASVI